MQLDFQTVTVLLLIAAVVAILTKRLHLPYSAGLVAAGIAMASFPFASRIVFTRELIYTGLLPPLLFEAAYHIHWDRLRRDALVVGVLATLGVILSGAATTMGMHFLAGWPWMTALLFGALIAATDPVSVISTFREAGVIGRLPLLIESESLFNDGTAAVAFGVIAAIAAGHQVAPVGILLLLVKSIGGGVICGAAVGIGSLLLTGRTEDHLVEITFTTVAAYGSFLLADSLGMSGVLATITAGLTMRNFKKLDGITPRGREAIENFWEYAAFISNSMIFLIIGTEQSHQNFLPIWVLAITGVAVVLLGRAIAVSSCCAIFAGSRLRVPAKHQFILFWGGLRGALALALALGLPEQLPYRNQIVSVSFAVVAFSVFVEGLSMTPLLRLMGEIPRRPAK